MTVDEADLMCPNCVTPWKCNGPHLNDQTPYALRGGKPADVVGSSDWTLAALSDGLALRELAVTFLEFHVSWVAGDKREWSVLGKTPHRDVRVFRSTLTAAVEAAMVEAMA